MQAKISLLQFFRPVEEIGEGREALFSCGVRRKARGDDGRYPELAFHVFALWNATMRDYRPQECLLCHFSLLLVYAKASQWSRQAY